MDKNRKKLIKKFQKWLDTNPRKQIIAAQCATIAEEYHKEQLKLYEVGSSMVKLCENTTNKDYAGLTDQIIAIIKNGQNIVLEPEDLKKLEQVIGGKFRR